MRTGCVGGCFNALNITKDTFANELRILFAKWENLFVHIYFMISHMGVAT